MENKWKNKNFFEALKNAIYGIRYVFKTERNFKIQLFFAVLAIVVSIILKINYIELSIIILLIFLIFFAEFFNTILEKVIDMYTEEYNEKAKIAKDIAAGAVAMLSISTVIIGGLIFFPKIYNIIIK